nr:MAG TPA: Putative amidoligase enzyme [Caudoviricetes sp.]
MEIITNAENRKELVKALAGHFGQRSEYLGPPSFAYRIGSITVDRDAKVILEDDSMEDEVRRVLFQNDVAEETQEPQTEEPEAEIKIPIGDMTPQGIINLINMMHSKQYLINRAAGRECISVTDTLTDALAERTFENTEEAVRFITEHGGCRGVAFKVGNIDFTGFPHADSMMEYCRLAAAMVKKASEQKRVNPKQTIEENEKYYMRAWLVSIGFGGSEGKEVRNFFLKGLKGHTAFRTPEDAEKWKANRRAERGTTVCSE